MRVRCGRCGSVFEVMGPGLHKCSVCDVTNNVRTAKPVDRADRSFGDADEQFPSPGWPREILQQATVLVSMCRGLLNVPPTAGRDARSAYEAELRRVVSERLRQIPVDALKGSVH